MSANINSTVINSTNAVPFISSDRTELAPLCSSPQDTKGLRVIISILTVFTLIVSMALMTRLHQGEYQVTRHGTVVSDDEECSAAGVTVMKKGGNAIDAVITTLFCLSVVSPHLVGIGGGGYLMVYDQRQRSVVDCLDFHPTLGSHSTIGVPGFVEGLYEAHKSLGRLSWPVLLNAAIEFAGSGFTPSASLLSAVPLAQEHNKSDLVELLRSGHNPQLFDTLQAIAENGSDVLYHGALVDQLAGLLTPEDLAGYRVLHTDCQTQLVGSGSHRLTVGGPGSGGPLLLQLLYKINQTTAANEPILTVTNSLKETKFSSRPYNTGVNVVAVDHNDIYVSAVSGLGSVLGSLELTAGGYIMNNLGQTDNSDDGRLSSLATPIVITQPGVPCGDRFILGANDVRDAAQLLVEVLHSVELGNSLTSVSDSPRARITHNQVLVESKHLPLPDVEQEAMLQAWNYTVTTAPEPYPSINIIHKVGDSLTPLADSRGGGGHASF